MSSIGFSQICTPDTISSVCFTMDACNANFSDTSLADYSEFTGNIINGVGGPEYTVIGDNIYRPDPEINTHSCTPGQNNAAICVSSQDDCMYTPGSDKALQFDILVTPGQDGKGSISCLSFYEASPEWFSWIGGSSGLNNYPQNFGVRVTVDGVEVFKQIDIATTPDWSFNNFSFENIPAFTVMEPTVFHFELLGYCTVGNGGVVNAWDVDEIKVLYKEDGVPDGGDLTTESGTNSIELCEGENITPNLENENGENYNYIITDETGVILGLPTTTPISLPFSNGTCFLWHLAYDTGLIGLNIGQNVADFQGCYNFSNSIEIIKHPNPEIVSFNFTDTSCGENNGNAAVVVNGGSGIYSYSWSNGATTASISNLVAGTYGITVTDSNGCDDQGVVFIGASTNPQVSVNKTDTSCGENNGAASATTIAGTGGYTYEWNTGATTSSVSSLSAGTYTVTVSDTAGCTDTETVIINNSSNPVVVLDKTDTSCGENNGSASAMTTSGTGGYTYEWNTGATTSSLNNLSAGTYTVTVSDSSGCTDVTSVVVNDSTSPLVTVNVISTSCGEDNGSASATSTAGTGGYTYVWSTGVTTSSLNNLGGGTYSVTVTDSAGCTDVMSVTISSSTNPIVSVSGVNTSCGENNGAASAISMAGTGGYSYLWNTGAVTSSINSLSAGTYTVTVTDTAGCTDTGSVTINDSTNPIVVVDKTDTSCGEDNGSASAMATSGTGGYTYLWNTGQTTSSIDNLSSGAYSVTVTDSAGCTAGFNITVNDSTNPVVTVNGENTSCGENNGSASATTTAGTGGYMYEWSTGAATSSIDNLSAGNYSVTVTDTAGCSDISSVTIDDSSNPEINISKTDTSCGENSGEATANVTGGTGGYIYEWSNGSSTATINNLSAGTYTVTVTDTAGCDDVSSVVIDGSSNPIVSITTTDTSCGLNNGSALADTSNGTGTYSYLWSNGSTSASITGLSAGTYSITVTDSQGCQDVGSVSIGASSEPLVNLDKTDTSCGENNGSAAANATSGTGGYTYLWSNGATTSSLSNLTAGTYTVTVTDTAGCTDTDSVTINDSTNPIVVVDKTDTSCGEDNGSASAMATSGTGGYTYLWNTGATTSSIDNLSSGAYSVTVTDSAGCTAGFNITVNDSTNPVVTVNGENTSCGENNGSASATTVGGTGGYTYLWSTGATTSLIDNLSAGTYIVTVSDTDGCSDTSSVTIEDSTNPEVSISKTDTSCGENNGEAIANVTGGTGGYVYLWSNGASTVSIDNLSSGTYTVTVTDTAGCEDISTVTIDSSTNPMVSINLTNTSCGLDNGSAIAVASNGSGSYSYLWSNGVTSSSISDLSSGSYTVTLTDSEGCQDVATVSIEESTNPVASAIGMDTSCGMEDGTATGNATSGSGGYLYSWSNGSTGKTISNLAAGNYTVTVTDSSGCTDTAAVVIGTSTSPMAAISATDTTCGEDNGSATASATSGSGGYSYAWSNGENMATISNLSPGTYTVTITDSESCTDVETIDILDSPELVVAISVTNTSCGENNGFIQLEAVNGSGGYTYAWSNGVTTALNDNLAAGNYGYTVTDNADCLVIGTLDILGSSSPLLAVTTTDTTCGENDGTAEASVTGGVSPYTYEWSNGFSSSSIDNLIAGNYGVTVTDLLGCTDEFNFTISSSDSPVVSIAGTDTSCGENNGSAVTNVTGGTGTYTYMWSTGDTTPSLLDITGGFYSVTVTDIQGCQSVDNVTIGSSSNPEISAAVSDEICSNNAGTVSLTVTGGSGDYTYNWSNGATTAILTNLIAGTYTVTVTDSEGCISVGAYTIINQTDLEIVVEGTDTCCGENNGTASVTMDCGIAPYSITWSNGDTEASLINLPPGTYTVTVVDAIGDTETGTVVVNDSTSPVVTIDGENTTCGENNGSASINITNGTAPYSIVWSNGEVDVTDLSDLASGSYTVTVTDAKGCTDTTTIVINPSILPDAGDLTGGPFLFCIDNTPDYVSGVMLNNVNGTNTTFIITDATGTIIASPNTLADLENYDFDADQPGFCYIYHLSYEDISGLTTGSNVQNLGGCYDLEGSIEVEKIGTGSDSSSVLFDMDACSAGVDFDEFTADIDNYNGCTQFDIIGDNLTAGFSHSCTPGINGSVGMCFTAEKSCTYSENTNRKLVVDLEVTPGSFGTGSISGISFYEQAPATFVWTDGTTGVNNFPTLYALRILKNGVEIFENPSLQTSSSWSLAQFDFSTMPEFTVTTTTTFTIELIPYCAGGNSSTDISIWDVDELLIYSDCDNPLAGGNLSGGPYDICLDGLEDNITDLSLSNFSGDLSFLLVTDENGNILNVANSFSAFEQINFDEGEEGTCLIWHLSADQGFTGAEVGNNVNTDFYGCFNLSNAVTVTKENCGNKISIFPNPTMNTVTIDVSSFRYTNMRYELVDNLGRVIMQNSKYDNLESMIHVDLSNLTEGRYYIKTVIDGIVKVTPIILVK